MRPDVMAFAVNCLFVLIYYLYLGVRTRRSPHSSVHALNARIRERWIESIMGKENREIIAVQTLRNSVMAAKSLRRNSGSVLRRW